MKLYIDTILILGILVCLSCNDTQSPNNLDSDSHIDDNTPIPMPGRTYRVASKSDVAEVHNMTDLVQDMKYVNVDTNLIPHYFTCRETGELNSVPTSLVAGTASRSPLPLHLRIVCSATDRDYLNSPFPAPAIGASYLQVLMHVVQNKADSLCLGLQISTEIDTDYETNLSSLQSSTVRELLTTRFACRNDRNEITVIISPAYMGLYCAYINPKIITITKTGFLDPTILLHEIGHTFDLPHPVCNCNLCTDKTCHFMYPRLRQPFCPAQVMIQDWLQIIDACGNDLLCSPCDHSCGSPVSSGDCWDCPLPQTVESIQTDTSGTFTRSQEEFRYYAKPQWRNQAADYAKRQSQIVVDFYKERLVASLYSFPSRINQFKPIVPDFFNLKEFNDTILMKRINPNLSRAEIDAIRNAGFMN